MITMDFVDNIRGSIKFTVECPNCGNVVGYDFEASDLETSTIWQEKCNNCDAEVEVSCTIDVDVDVTVTKWPTKNNNLYERLTELKAEQADLVETIEYGTAEPSQCNRWRRLLEEIAEIDAELEELE